MRLRTVTLGMVLVLLPCLAGCGHPTEAYSGTTHFAITKTMKRIIQLDPGYRNYLRAIIRRLPHSATQVDVRRTVDIDARDRISLYTYDHAGVAFYNESLVSDSKGRWAIVMSARPELYPSSTPFTQTEISGISPTKTSFFAIGGMITSPQIRHINIYFVDKPIGSVPIEPAQRSYLFVRQNSLQGIKSLVALNQHNDTIYEIGNG